MAWDSSFHKERVWRRTCYATKFREVEAFPTELRFVMLFLTDYAFGRHAGYRPWPMGFWMAGIGSGLSPSPLCSEDENGIPFRDAGDGVFIH